MSGNAPDESTDALCASAIVVEGETEASSKLQPVRTPPAADLEDEEDGDEDDEGAEEEMGNMPASGGAPQTSKATSTAVAPTVAVVSKKKGRKKLVIINTSSCRYHVVRLAAMQLDWAVEDDGREDVPESLEMSEAQRSIIDRHFGHRYKPETSCQVYWTDMSVLLPRVSSLKCFHRLNHFPNMHLICRKMLLFVRLSAMQEVLPKLYNFFPTSFSLKSEFRKLDDYIRSLRGKPKTFVMKPNAGCQGRGIILTRNPIKVSKTLKDHDYTVQLYVHRPLLIDGKKFDMRVYVLLLTMEKGSASIFVHREGLVRICAEPYMKPTAENLSEVCMHLTNYSVNKESDKYEAAASASNDSAAALPGVVNRPFMGHPLPPTLSDEDGWTGNKRSFRFLEHFVNQQQQQQGNFTTAAGDASSKKKKAGSADDDEDLDEAPSTRAEEDGSSVSPWIRLRRKIDRAVVLTILSALPELRQSYSAANAMSGPRVDCRNCFELLGYDVLVTQSGHVHVLEVNHSPSLFCDTALDTAIKCKVVSDVFRLLEPHIPDIRKMGDSGYQKHIAKPAVQSSFARAQRNVGFRRVYPLGEGGDENGDDDDCEEEYKKCTMEAYEEALERAAVVFASPGQQKPVTPESESKVARTGSMLNRGSAVPTKPQTSTGGGNAPRPSLNSSSLLPRIAPRAV